MIFTFCGVSEEQRFDYSTGRPTPFSLVLLKQQETETTFPIKELDFIVLIIILNLPHLWFPVDEC
jgi:hypothetical protein